MKYLNIGGRKIYVKDKVYKALRKSYRHERYLKENKIAHGELNIEGLKYELSSDYTVEDEIERSETHKKLWVALEKLEDDEFDFINKLFFERMKIKNVANELQLPLSTAYYKRDRILRKLYSEIVQMNE